MYVLVFKSDRYNPVKSHLSKIAYFNRSVGFEVAGLEIMIEI